MPDPGAVSESEPYDENSAAEVVVDEIDNIVLLDTVNGLKRPNALPAIRPPVTSVKVEEYTEKQKRRRTKDKRRKLRKRQRKNKRRFKDRNNVINNKKSHVSRGSYSDFSVRKTVSGKKRIKWGKGKRGRGQGGKKAPPFASILNAVEESDYVPHSSGELRTTVMPLGGDLSSETFDNQRNFKSHRRRPRERG